MFFTVWMLVIVNKQLTGLILLCKVFETSSQNSKCLLVLPYQWLVRHRQKKFHLSLVFAYCTKFAFLPNKPELATLPFCSIFPISYSLVSYFVCFLFIFRFLFVLYLARCWVHGRRIFVPYDLQNVLYLNLPRLRWRILRTRNSSCQPSTLHDFGCQDERSIQLRSQFGKPRKTQYQWYSWLQRTPTK